MEQSTKASSTVTRHRARLRAAGLRSVQLWVLDTRSKEFAAEIKQQCLNLKNDSNEKDILHFTELAAGTIEGWV